jgi:flagellar hook protein FlgE
MIDSLNTAVSGLQQFQQDIDVIGNNIANVNTTGFKNARINFEDTFSQALGFGTTIAQVGTGVQTAAIQNNFTQGSLSNTGGQNDMAISGQGFFAVRNAADGSQFVTRAGDFKVDNNGYLTTSEGLRVQGYSDSALSVIGDIKIDATGAPANAAPGATVRSYSVDQTGKINVLLSDGTLFIRGQVLLQTFIDPSKLVKQGSNLYTPMTTAGAMAQLAAPQTQGLGTIQSGALEMSNVDLSGQMASLIAAQRGFQANARIVTTSDEVLQEVVNLKR